MRSPFSKFAARSRMSWNSHKLSQSEKSEASVQQKSSPRHCIEREPETLAKNDDLMESLFELLDQDHPKSPLYHAPFKVKNSDVAKWADSISPFVSSPIDLTIPDNTNDHKSTRISTSTLSSAGSLLSESSSCEDPKGPKTPTFPPANLVLPRLPIDADIRLARPATSYRAEPKIHRAFSFELIPEAPFRPAPPIPSNNTRNEAAAKTLIESSNISPCPDFSATSVCQATITSLIDDFMPKYIPSPKITPAKKKTSVPLLRIDTRGFHTPIQQVRQPEIPEIEFSQPPIPTVEMLSLGYKAYSESRAEQDRKLLSFSEREVSSSRHSIAHLVPRNNTNYDDYRKGTSRYSIQAPSKRLLNDLQEQNLFIPQQYKPYSPPQPILRRSPVDAELHITTDQKPYRASQLITRRAVAEAELHMGAVRKPVPVKYTPYSVPKPIQIQPEIETVQAPIIAPCVPKAKREEPLAFATNRGVSLAGDFFAKEQGLQLKMTRTVNTFSKMEWVIQDLSGTRRMKCFAQANSLSRRKDFLDLERNVLFSFQKKIGSTRLAETPSGTEVFSIQNASLPSLPHWIIKMVNGNGEAPAPWVAKGDEDMQNVIVSWDGSEVGRIRCESRLKKHTYIVSVAAEVNYAVMAALTTVFDDLRTDEGC